MKIFADTSFFVAYYNIHDQYHSQTAEILKSLIPLNPSFFTSDYIYDETLTFLLQTHPFYGYKRAQKYDQDINEGKITLVFISESIFSKAKEIFLRFNKDKRWSFTDCVSFALMEDFGINKVLTFDHNFREMGFKIVE